MNVGRSVVMPLGTKLVLLSVWHLTAEFLAGSCKKLLSMATPALCLSVSTNISSFSALHVVSECQGSELAEACFVLTYIAVLFCMP